MELSCAAAMLVSACSREPSRPDLHSITGHIRLTGYLVNGVGQFAGTRVVDDADGIVVKLAYGSGIIAQTTTVDGVYHFTGLGPGAYVARTFVIGRVADTTEVLTVAAHDVNATDTLRLAARGDLYPVPNPFVQSTSIYFEVPDSQYVEIKILDMAGIPIRTLVQDGLAAGLHGVIWNGRDQGGNMATASLYWVTFVAGSDIRAHLLFR